MSFSRSADVLQRAGGGRFNIQVANDELWDQSRPQEVMGEYGLVEAVLREAIREYQKFAGHRGRRGSRLFREVHEWFLQDDRKWNFSFINVCQILDLEPTYIRTGLKIWCERNVAANGAQDIAPGRTRRIRRRRETPLLAAESHASIK